MGDWRYDTLTAMVENDANLHVKCDCGRDAVIDAKRLLRHFNIQGWDVRMDAVTNHLRCKRCGCHPRWAVHTNYAGLRLQAWAGFNLLLPTVEKHLADKSWPRPSDPAAPKMPTISPRRITFSCK